MSEPLELNRTMNFAYGEPAEMVPGVVRLVANNPSPFTFQGTNTYLIGTRSLAVVDPGPDDEAHVAAILRAASGRPITHVLITHTHRDHTAGLGRLIAATGALTAGFPRPLAATAASRDASPSGDDFIDSAFKPDQPLAHGARVAGEDWALTALHTPGHAPDHLCFAVEVHGADGVVLTGDHVMGWNTSVIAPPEGNMADYLASLELLLARPADKLYLPGHGGRIRTVGRTVKAYLLHRRWREQAILGVIAEAKGHATIRTTVPRVYRDLDARLLQAASLSVQAHVEHLAERGLVRYSHPLTWDRDLSAV
jgi:glyoxylase-like metal-dependent hydrolase (beta-lactamase superfamily II)